MAVLLHGYCFIYIAEESSFQRRELLVFQQIHKETTATLGRWWHNPNANHGGVDSGGGLFI